MKKKDELIIGMYGQVLDGVYSLDPTLCAVSVFGNEDKHYPDSKKRYWRNHLLVLRGCVSDISVQYVSEKTPELPLRLESKAVEELTRLFAHSSIAEEKLHFLEGFLYSWATVNQKITAMCRSANGGERMKGKEMYEIFKPTLQSWLERYDELFDDLWQYADVEGEM